MRALPRALLLTAGLHLAAVTSPAVAWAQGPEPVPYPAPPPPTPYGQPAPPPPPPGASPATTGQDTIFMKNGGILRGIIVDAIPGAQARIQLATGEIASVPWSAIARIEHGAPAGPPPPPVTLPEARRGAMVWVHLDGADNAELQRQTGDGDWTTVCSGSCNAQVPAGMDYRIAGGGIRASRPFHLMGAPGDHVSIDVDPASTGWFVMGIVIVPIGGLMMLVGLAIGLVGSIAADTSSGVDQQNANSAATAGWVTFALGTAAMVGGVLLIVNNVHTSASQTIGGVQTGLLLQGDPWKRVPTWKEATPVERGLPPVVGLPVWTGRF